MKNFSKILVWGTGLAKKSASGGNIVLFRIPLGIEVRTERGGGAFPLDFLARRLTARARNYSEYMFSPGLKSGVMEKIFPSITRHFSGGNRNPPDHLAIFPSRSQPSADCARKESRAECGVLPNGNRYAVGDVFCTFPCVSRTAMNIQPLRGWGTSGIQNRTALSGRGRPQKGETPSLHIYICSMRYSKSAILQRQSFFRQPAVAESPPRFGV